MIPKAIPKADILTGSVFSYAMDRITFLGYLCFVTVPERVDSKPTGGSLVAKVVGTQTCFLRYIQSEGEKANHLKAVMFQGC